MLRDCGGICLKNYMGISLKNLGRVSCKKPMWSAMQAIERNVGDVLGIMLSYRCNL